MVRDRRAADLGQPPAQASLVTNMAVSAEHDHAAVVQLDRPTRLLAVPARPPPDAADGHNGEAAEPSQAPVADGRIDSGTTVDRRHDPELQMPMASTSAEAEPSSHKLIDKARFSTPTSAAASIDS